MRYEDYFKNEALQASLFKGYSLEQAYCILEGIQGFLKDPDWGIPSNWFIDITPDWVGVRKGATYAKNTNWIKCTETHWIQSVTDQIYKLEHREMYYIIENFD